MNSDLKIQDTITFQIQIELNKVVDETTLLHLHKLMKDLTCEHFEYYGYTRSAMYYPGVVQWEPKN